MTIDEVDPRQLFGFNDAHLRRVEAAFPDAKIIARGNQLILSGPDATLDALERVMGEMTVVLNRNGQLTDNDVTTVLAVFGGGDGLPISSTEMHDVVLLTPSGGMVRAKTPNQKVLVSVARDNDIVFAVGPAGTGKTYTSVALAVGALKSRQVKRIVLSRPAVEAGEKLGFLPGDLREKIDPYLRPLYDALEDMVPREKLRAHMEQNVVEIVPLAYMRGRTLHNAFVILDEAQNATTQQMKMFLTRLGVGSRAIITGDTTQIDLPKRSQSGLLEAVQILRGIEGIGFVQFDRGDVVRHRLVKEIIEAYERAEESEDGER